MSDVVSHYQQRKLDQRCTCCGAGLLPEWGMDCVECTERRYAKRRAWGRTRHGRAWLRRYQRSWTARNREHKRALNKRAYEKLKTSGACVRCGAKGLPDSIYCGACLAPAREIARVSQIKIRATRDANGLCPRCGKAPPREGRKTCAECAQYHADYNRKKREQKRKEAA